MLKRLFPNLAAMPAEELMILPLIIFMFMGLFAGGLKLIFAG
jgi:hypothetical protein